MTLTELPLLTMTGDSQNSARLKRELRVRAHAARRDQPDKEVLSRTILGRFSELPEYAQAETVMCYVHVRDEVRTVGFLQQAMRSGKQIVIPYCLDDELKLFHLEDMAELETGCFGILEPRGPLRAIERKHLDAAQLDLVMVPGVAFDASGGRLGHGRAYYDRLLVGVRADAPLVAPAFECQIFPEIPMSPHDVFMDLVLTEEAAYRGQGRAANGDR